MFIFGLLRKIEHVQIKCTILLGFQSCQELFEHVQKYVNAVVFGRRQELDTGGGSL
jgi:hypothetical protein